MRELLSRRARWITVGVLSVVATTAAFALPWDVDMADNQGIKGYERDMGTLPAGVVAQDSIESPKEYHTNYKRGSAEGEALQNPLPDSPETLATGQKMFGIYCSPCHGADGVHLGPVAAPGRLPGVVPLGGPAGMAHLRSDAWIYLTVRNGGAVMPAYDWALSDKEIWSIVKYVRTLDNGKYVPPAEAP